MNERFTATEAAEITAAWPACTTAPNGTGARCTCEEACANYVLRSRGYRAEG
jgi:hypothetical protein